MTRIEAANLAKKIHEAALPDVEVLNILEGGLPDESRQWAVRCKYTGPEKWWGDTGLVPGMTLAIMNPETWESIKTIILDGSR